MDAVKEANGSMLDNSIPFFGSTLSDPSVHSQRDLPVMLAGGAAGISKLVARFAIKAISRRSATCT